MPKLPWGKKRQPLGKLEGRSDYIQAVRRIAGSTQGGQGQLGTILAMWVA